MLKHTVEVREGESFVRVTMVGSITRKPSLRVVKDSMSEAAKHQVKGFLVDVREAHNVDTITDQYYFGAGLSDVELGKSIRVAIVVSAEDNSHDFIETVARNQGYPWRLVNDMKTAITWLVE